jgi:hypothetical protein
MMAQATAKSLADQSVAQAAKRAKVADREAFQAQKLGQKIAETSPEIHEEVSKKCLMLERYKKCYNGKINHKFRATYDPERISLEAVNHEITMIKMELNSSNMPWLINEGMKWLAKGAVLVSISFGSPALVGFDKDIEDGIEIGEFKEEVDQISIEWAEWLLQTPEQRLGGKLVKKLAERWTANSTKAAFGQNPAHSTNDPPPSAEPDHPSNQAFTHDL